LESEAFFFNVLENCDSEDKPMDIVSVQDINNEGFSRKEVHIAIETVSQIVILSKYLG
jgi:hypothetical protein